MHKRALLGALLAGTVIATALTGCVGQAVRSTEEWLAAQPHVVSIGVPSSTIDELSYKATLRAELDPAATDADIDTLIDNALDYVATQPGDDVTLQFGIKNIDFEVATKADARTALALWRQVIPVPRVVGGLVGPTTVSVTSLRQDSFAVFDALEPLGVTREIAGYHAATDFDVSTTTFQPPITLTAAPDCVADATALALAQSAMRDDRVDFGTLDLCEGFDLTFTNGYLMVSGVPGVRSTLDDAGLSDFPVTISVAPAQASSPNFHIVAVTPGDPAALAVVDTLETAGFALRYELSADRSLDIESTDATAAQLLTLLFASPAIGSLGTITIVGSDKTITGPFASLAP